MWRFAIPLLTLCAARAAETIDGWAVPPEWAKRTQRHPLNVTLLEASTTIRGTLATTSMTFSLAVTGDQTLEAVMEFPLPGDTLVTGAALDIQDFMRAASVAVPSTAKTAYDSIVNGRMDPCLVQMLPNGRVKVRVYPVPSGTARRVRLDFVQTLTPTAAGPRWSLPLAAEPEGQAALTVDSPGHAKNGTWILPDAKTAAGFTVDTAWPPAGEAVAEPDSHGGYVFHHIMPETAEPAPPARRVLMVVDASAGQAGRDAAAEERFLHTALAGAESVTLATWSAGLHGVETFPVMNGACAALDSRLRAIRHDGASFPWLVDLSGIPADLVIVSSALRGPAGGAAPPRLPAGLPVMVLDSVSPTPSIAAVALAGETGGEAVDPRRLDTAAATKILTRRPSQPLPPGIRRHRMSTPGWLEISGPLTADQTVLRMDSKTELRFTRGQDAARGRMIFTLLNAATARTMAANGLPQESILDQWRKAPALSESSSFIVMEEMRDYERNRIDFPPDLGTTPKWAKKLDPPGWRGELLKAASRMDDYKSGQLPQKWSYALNGDKAGWWYRRNSWKKVRDAVPEPPVQRSSSWTPLPEETVRAALSAGGKEALDIIREAKLREAGRIAEPLEGAADPFSGGGSGFGSASQGIDPSSSGPATATAPEGVPAPDTTGSSRESQPVLPKESPPDLHPLVAAWQKETAATGYRVSGILSRARALRAAGQNLEARRVLSDLFYVPSLPPPIAARLLLWELQEWGETGLATQLFNRFLQQWPNDSGISMEATIPRIWTAPPTGADLGILMECAATDADADLEIIGPDFEKASWENPLPLFGGALSPDGNGTIPEEFLLPAASPAEYTVSIYLGAARPCPVRVTVITRWGRPDERRQVFLLPECPPGRTTVTKLTLPEKR